MSAQSKEALDITLLGSEWYSSAGGLSTLNRELAIHLSQQPNVRVSLLVPEGACKDEDKKVAQSFGVHVLDASQRPGFSEPLDWLGFPPQDHRIDVVVGHGVKLGRQVQVIKLSPQFQKCKWVHMVHTAPEDLSKYKGYDNPTCTSGGEQKHWDEVDLCKYADLVVPVGPRLKKAYSSYLQGCKKDEDIFEIVPGLFTREFGALVQRAKVENGDDFKVLLCGRGDDEDLELNGIAVKAFADQRLKGKRYFLLFVGAPNGKQDEVRRRLLNCGINDGQLTVRKFVQSRARMRDLFCEVDLVIMPSISEGFGLVALEALSASLPVLVGRNSGFARTLQSIPLGAYSIVDSEDPVKWAEAIEGVHVRHSVCLEESKLLREFYGQEYCWRRQCEALVDKLWRMVHESSTCEASTADSLVGQQPSTIPGVFCQADLTTMQQHATQEGAVTSRRTSKSSEERGMTANETRERSNPQLPAVSKDKTKEGKREREEPSLCAFGDAFIRLLISVSGLTEEQEENVYNFLAPQVQTFVKSRDYSSNKHKGVRALTDFINKAYEVSLMAVNVGSLEIIVGCPTLKSLEHLWNDYLSGHLNKVAQRYLVTSEMKKKLNLETINLKTTIDEENYLACRKLFTQIPGEADSALLSSQQGLLDQGSSTSEMNTSADYTAAMPKSQKKKWRETFDKHERNLENPEGEVILKDGSELAKSHAFSLVSVTQVPVAHFEQFIKSKGKHRFCKKTREPASRESTASWNAENMREEDGEGVADEEGAKMQTHHGQENIASAKRQENFPRKHSFMERGKHQRGRCRGIRGRGRGRDANTSWPGGFLGEQQCHQQYGITQRGPVLGYRKLKELQSTDPSETAVSLLKYRESFQKLVNADSIKEDWMTLLIEIFGKMCVTTLMTENLIEVMSLCKGSALMRDHLPKYIIQLPMIQEEKPDDEVSVIIRSLIDFFREWLVRFPRLCSEIPIDNLYGSFDELNMDGVEDFKREVESLLKRRRELVVEERKKPNAEQEPKKTKRIDVEKPPPDDFREMSIYPIEKEIFSEEKPFLRRNKVGTNDKYKDFHDYLDVQFRLLREDFVSPLREGIREIIKNIPERERSQNLYIYENVEILTSVFTRAGIVHSIHLDMKRLRKIPWEHSKRLLFGSFLCLSKDNFKTMLFATVANRKAEDLRAGKLEIRFVSDLESTHKTREKYVMVESPAYFEAYRPILEQLKKITPDAFPFQEYLVHCNSDVKPPKYLRCGRQVLYDMENTFEMETSKGSSMVSIIDTKSWPHAEDVHLNTSQLEALKGALTKEFSVIQGPPGTGKTYLGLKIVKALLDNRQVWDSEEKSSMLMVCYTNHALDQFLEGVLKFHQTGIIRVGGRSSSENLRPYNLNEYTTYSENQRRVKEEMAKCQEAIQKASDRLARSMSFILTLKDLNGFAARIHIQQLRTEESQYVAQGKSVVESWLGVKNSYQTMPRGPTSPENGGSIASDEDNAARIDVDRDADMIQSQRMLGENQFGLIVGQNPSIKQDKQWFSCLSKDHIKVLRGESKLKPLHFGKVASVKQIWDLCVEDRWKLYLFWLRLYQEYCKEQLSTKRQEYERICKRLIEVRDSEELHVLRDAVVIGMTTTGAAKYRTIIEVIQPTIVIVEEAAEVLEAHIIPSLTKGTQHLILIGDHKQLRPNPSVYSLARQYNLDVSLFERMVNCGMHCYQLETQHRMRPEIASLMRFFYDNLEDHDTVHKYESVSGVSKNIFFVDHQYPEDDSEINEKIKSHSNQHEAEYIAALCEYFLMQGYEPNQITVLTMYTGQVLALKKTMPKTAFDGVRVTAVDNFQGEENDIILLSLVRSNEKKKIGFLAVRNRICVALSRARKGLYCIGDFSLLSEKSDLWRKLVHDMKGCGALGETLELVCSNHPERKIYAKVADDFKRAPEGGCTLPCQFRLCCGHVCERVCHPDDADHQLYKCQKNCATELCLEHQSKCDRKCHHGEDCLGCPVKVVKAIPSCGHLQSVPCGTPADTFKCQEKCQTFLSCGHLCPGKCWEECAFFDCQIIVKKKFDCGHEAEKPCFEFSDKGYRCEEPCRAILECQHPCVGNCNDCKQGRMHVPCQADCDRRRVCLHLCREPCTTNCPLCPEKCENRCIHSKCPQTCKRLCTPCREPCRWNCKHKTCTKLCWEECNRERCNEPCTKRLPSTTCRYRHPCIGLCGEPCPQLCRLCHKDKVTEVFFGTEEEEDARFIELQDCGHIFEVTAMDYWMDNDGDNETIMLKECPRCKTPIRISYRYGNIVKGKLAEVEEVKKRLLKEEKRFKVFFKELEKEASRLRKLFPDIEQRKILCGMSAREEEQASYSKSVSSYETLMQWLQQRKTMAELNTIQNQLELLKQIYKVRKEVKKDLLRNTPHQSLETTRSGLSPLEESYLDAATEVDLKLNRVENDLMKFQVSPQSLTDIRDEMICIGLLLRIRVVECEVKKRSIDIDFVNEEWLERQGKQLDTGKRLTQEEADGIEAIINRIRKECGLEGLTAEERVMIVKAMNFAQGHWYKCPNGHIYAIGECGGANQQRTCPDCDATIGGTNHRLFEGNQVATEMDGALHPAWSDHTNMRNYDPAELRRLQFE